MTLRFLHSALSGGRLSILVSQIVRILHRMLKPSLLPVHQQRAVVGTGAEALRPTQYYPLQSSFPYSEILLDKTSMLALVGYLQS